MLSVNLLSHDWSDTDSRYVVVSNVMISIILAIMKASIVDEGLVAGFHESSIKCRYVTHMPVSL